MTDLSENLLAAAREGLTPDAAIAARVRARVAAAVASGAAAGAVASTAQAATATTTGANPVIVMPALVSIATPTTAPATSAGGLGLAAKLGGVLLALGIVAATVAVVSSRTPATTAPDVSAVTAASSDELASHIHVAAPADAAPSVVAPDHATGSTTRPVTPVRRASRPAAHVAAPATLSREVELIDRAMLALRRGDARAALAAIDVFEVETRGHGQMAEDAAAVAIEARCQLGEDVSERLARFDRAWPSSAQRERLQSACYSGR